MKFIASRNETLLNSVVFTDGQPGCGKTLFTPIISTLKRVEIFNFTTEIENLCSLNYLKKMDHDAVIAMLRIQMDLDIYELMMSRRLNFRPDDLSSAFKNPQIQKYIKRLFNKGDNFVPDQIKKNKPILHYATHNLLAYSKPIFDSFPGKVSFIEIVRHPIYQIFQQEINYDNWSKKNGTARQFHLYYQKEKKQFPYWASNCIEEYFKANSIEKAILEMHYITNLTNFNKKNILNQYKNNILTIPFEKFVYNPSKYIFKIEKLLKTKRSKYTNTVMKEQNVPRLKISDSANKKLYSRYGWIRPKENLSELKELELRKKLINKKNIKDKYLKILEKLNLRYEKKYDIKFI